MRVEHLMFDSDPFLLGGSSGRNAKLWLAEGKSVGAFGQEKRWNLRNPSTFAHPRNSWAHIRSERKEKKKKRTSAKHSISGEGPLLNTVEPLRATEQEAVEKAKCDNSREKTKNNKTEPKDLPQESQLPRIDHHRQTSPAQVPSEEVAQSRLMTPLSNVTAPRKYESLFKHNLEEGLLKRIARRKVRRRVFGEINTKKVNQFGTACSPFHALATTEMLNFTLPSDLPMTSRMKSKGIVCTTESDLKSLQLTFPELDEEGHFCAEGRKSSDRRKPLDQTKMPALPPLIKPSRSRLSENKKTSGCHLPSVPKVTASISLKWGKY